MKRLIAILLSLILLLSWGSGLAEEPTPETTTEATPSPEETAEPTEVPTATPEPYVHDELRVGNPTPMDGKFFTGMWGNATTDIDVRTLVNSYYLTVWGYDTGVFRENRQVVSDLEVIGGGNGEKTYMFSLYHDLKYSDGTPITAWDYAFSALFQAAPVIAELGGVPMDLDYLVGYQEYISGEKYSFSGIRVLNDYTIAFTVKQEYLPYFFELFRMGFLPYPIHEIAPGCKVYDDGQGAYIGNEDRSIKEQIFSKELLEATVMDPDFGYLAHPTVGSGPYVLTSWDGEVATFEINEYFKGDEEGNLPTIPKLHFTLAKNEDMIQKLEEREFDLLNKVTREDSIQNGMQLTGSGPFSMQNYPRIGLTFIVFTPDRKALQEQNVRKAIDYCLDTETTVREYTGGFGTQMDGLIGLGQWMYALAMGTMDYPISVQLTEESTEEEKQQYEEELALWQEVNLDGLKHYPLDVEEAVRLLEENGWTLNERGEAFVPGQDEVRFKQIDGELVGLDLTCAYPETNRTAESMETLFVPNLAQAGIRLTLIPMDMKTLLRSYNDRDIEEIDMFYLGDDFNIEFDPQLFFLPGDPTAPEEDTLAWVHAQMYEYARLMCETEPDDVLGFVKKWVTFQEHLSDMLPMIPVYSNVYFDFYTLELMNYDIRKWITWGDAIVPSTMGLDVINQLAADAENAEANGGEEDEPDLGEDDFDAEEFDDDF